MYCKKCNSLIENNELICPNCNYDNKITDDSIQELEIANDSKTKNKIYLLPIIIIILFLSTGIICIYVINDTKANKSDSEPITTTESLTILNNTFTLNDISLNYPDNFGASANTIFYKNNNDFNIVIKTITEIEYQELINSNQTLNSKLGNIDTLTFALETSYYHVFLFNNQYYSINVNYIAKDTLESINVQLDMSKIINSLKG